MGCFSFLSYSDKCDLRFDVLQGEKEGDTKKQSVYYFGSLEGSNKLEFSLSCLSFSSASNPVSS